MIMKFLAKRMREGDGSPEADLTFPPDYDAAKARVTIQSDLEYPSGYHDSFYDLYYPKDCATPLPTVLWIHGGGFIAGTRYGIVNVAVMLAAAGYSVVAAEYARPPEAKHPAALRQMEALYLHLREAALPQVDLQNLFLAGDSAGAQIASEFAAAETNPRLAEALGLQGVIPREDLRGAILTCGPYDLARIRQVKNTALRLGLWCLGRAMFRGRPWHKSKGCKQSITADHVTAAYPPAYITDGNSGSFEVQGRRLGDALRRCGVPVTERYFDPAEGEVPHEYLFHLADETAQLGLGDIIKFIETYRRPSL